MNYIHPTANVAPNVVIGEGTKIWGQAQVREDVTIGERCIVGRNAYIDHGVTIGSDVKIQGNASLYHGVELEDGVFVGPHVIFTNDRVPRAINPDGSLKAITDWTAGHTLVQYGAALGAGTVVITGVTIGRWALVGSGSVVTHDVPDHALVVGNPARIIGYVSAEGVKCPTQEKAIELTKRETTPNA